MMDDSDARTHAADLVSVIVPVYNGQEYLPRCIDSIIHQSYAHVELILINDGSVDFSAKICDDYARSDSRICVIHTVHAGPASARNEGLEKSKGAFIVFVDADDFLENYAVKLLVEHYHKTKADLIVGDFKSIHNNISGPGHKGVFPDNKLLLKPDIVRYARGYLKRPNKYTLFAYSWGRLYKASIIKEHHLRFNPALFTYEDVAFLYDYLKYSNQVYYLKEAIYSHVFHDHYLSATMRMGGDPKRLFGYREALDHLRDYLKSYLAMADIDREVGHAYVSLTIIQFIRACGQITTANRKTISNLVREIILQPALRNSLPCYTPSPGDSRIIPILMKWRLVGAIVWACRYKAYQRYGKGAAPK